MKTSMERHLPLMLDIQEQATKYPDRQFVFFYDDGSIFRALMVDDIAVNTEVITGLNNKNEVILKVPADTQWRLVHKDFLEYVSGGVLEQMELIGMKQKSELKDKMIKKLGWDVDETTGKVKKSRKPKPGDPKTPGQYL